MHKFMRAIGFCNCYSKQQFDQVIKDVMSCPDEEYMVTDHKNRKLFQLKKRYSTRMGVSVMGEIDQFGFRNVLYAFPFVEGLIETEEMEIQLQKFAEKDAFAGISEDYNLGVSLIFYVMNVAPTIDRINRKPNEDIHSVVLSALSTDGTILFGVEKDDQQLQEEYQDGLIRRDLFQKAQNGDADAIESITLQDIDLSALIARRAQQEDIYSIVDTTFMPYGVESDQYTIVGYIDNIFKFRNVQTNDLVYILEVVCNDVHLSVSINAKDLFGEPQVGRRFKGNIWMQGLLLND